MTCHRPLALTAVVFWAALSSRAAVPDRIVTIGIIGKSETNPVFPLTRAGAERAAAEFGASHHVTVHIDWRTPKAEDPQVQADTIKRLTDEHVDGIAVACSDRRLLTAAIDAAVDHGVPVACFNSDAAGSRRFYFSGADDQRIGSTLMAELAKAMGGRGVIGVLAGNPRAPNLLERVRAVRAAAATYPDVVLRGVFYSEETPGSAFDRISRAMRANPDITGWVLVGGWSLFSTQPYPWAPGEVKCVAVASMPEQLERVRSGYVQSIVVQSSYDWGYRAVTRLLEKCVDHRDPPAAIEYPPMKIFNSADVEKYALAVQNHLHAAAAAQQGQLLIGLIGKSAQNGAFTVVREGAQQAASDLGTQYGLTIRVEDLSPPKESARAQAAALQRLLLEGADGIDIACSDTALLSPVIDEAVEAGVPVATFGSDAPASHRFYCYLADNEQCGETLMTQLAGLMKGHGVVGILGGKPEAENMQDRVQGARTIASFYPGISVRDVFYCSDVPQEAAARIRAAMQANPDIRGWLLCGSWPLSAPQAFPWAPGAVRCVSVGVLPSQLAYVRDGHVDVVIAQPYFQWGYQTVKRLVNKILLHRAPPETVESAPIEMVSRSNASEYQKRVMKRWLVEPFHPAPLPPPSAAAL